MVAGGHEALQDKCDNLNADPEPCCYWWNGQMTQQMFLQTRPEFLKDLLLLIFTLAGWW